MVKTYIHVELKNINSENGGIPAVLAMENIPNNPRLVRALLSRIQLWLKDIILEKQMNSM